jgi:hypothetical protein
MGRRDGLRDARDRAAAVRLQGLHRADANRRARRGWDAWDGVHRDEGADAARLLLRVRAGARCAEKLAGRERGVRARDVKLHWAALWALCKPDAGRSGA